MWAGGAACDAREVHAEAAGPQGERFEDQERARIAALRALHGTLAAEPMLLHGLAQAQDVPAAARIEIDEKLQIYQTRIDEADNAIESLAIAGREDWARRHQVATRALARAEDARADAWRALRDLAASRHALR